MPAVVSKTHGNGTRSPQPASPAVTITLTALFVAAVALIAAVISGGVRLPANASPASPAITHAQLTALTTPAASQRTWVVTSGNTLSGISQEEYGTPSCWPGIWDANTGVIGNDPDVLRTGEHLVIPAGCSVHTAPVNTENVVQLTAVTTYYDPSASILSESAIERLWVSAGGPSWAEYDAYRISMCESGDNRFARNPYSGAAGLMQILGSVVPGNLYDARVNMLNAVSKFRASKDTFGQWVCRP